MRYGSLEKYSVQAILGQVPELFTYTAAPTLAGLRLDHGLAQLMPQYSRARLQGWAKEGRVLVDGRVAKPSFTLKGGEVITVQTADLPALHATPEDLPLHILYEDDDVIAVDKPSGMVVHAGAGVHEGTLVNALLHRFETLSKVGGDTRPGIVHRLDRYTSGVLLVARNDRAHRALAAQFASRQIRKVYLTAVQGRFNVSRGVIEKPITRDPVHRTRMTAKLAEGRSAYTEYEVLREYSCCSYLRVRIGTGRTHQIRVHLSSIGHPVVGDALYGAAKQLPCAPEMPHYFLHAHEITFVSPSTSEPVTVSAPLPQVLQTWLDAVE